MDNCYQNKNRIVIISGVFYPEPVVSAGLMKDLATELSKDYQVTVLRPKPSRPMGFSIPDYTYYQFPFEVIETNSYVHPASSLIGRGRESYSMGKWCVRYIEQHHEEICFIYNGPWHMFGRSMVERSCLKYNIPYITPVQDIYPESLSSKLPNLPFLKKIVYGLLFPSDKSLLSHAAKIHTISDKMVDYLSKTRNLPKDHFFVVRNWQDESTFVKYANEKEDSAKSDVFTFMYLGNVGPLAGIDVLFDAFMKAELPDARLVIAGSGSAKQNLMEKAKGYSECNIEFWEVPAGEVPATQDKADVMVLPVKKGFAMSSIPSKLPAYMFSAKPVLASVDAESDTALCIKESDAGWVAMPEDVESITAAMKTAYSSSKEELRAKGKRGFDYAINHFSKQKNLCKLTDICISVIKG
jgi:glycosyltransferase involved in cell wall biosynthesis